ncbi:MAG: hypothetical protein CVV23_11735 [Ignavibacteriae bacterium HGW-Ignavibacteriae-2]|jgi:hypothetical protein|nr:DUF2459 domain-containing protein [Bacteroidota bacterium]PKL88152.1 MAG: hypothetical protein CVV23_11735 [Ignavibacteriae bacterium HGW-Ignavibacteriae-2]
MTEFNFKKKVLLVLSICLTLGIGNYSIAQPEYRSIYLIKMDWHVGLMIPVDSITISKIPVLENFSRFNYVDIGWGDEDFYMDPEIDYLKAFKAIAFPTSSVVKITGHSADLKLIVKFSELFVKINTDSVRYNLLLNFINNSFSIDKANYQIKISRADGAIIFYKSQLKYSLLYTCNTWIADGLKYAKFDIEPNEIITSDQLFNQVFRFGEIIHK